MGWGSGKFQLKAKRYGIDFIALLFFLNLKLQEIFLYAFTEITMKYAYNINLTACML